MKFILKQILKYYLKYITKLILLIHRPVIIAIAGSTNKTFVKDEISKVLRELFSDEKSPRLPKPDTGGQAQPPLLKGEYMVRSNPKSFNTEIGLPLAILNLRSGYSSYKNWLPIILKSILKIFQFNFPNFLVLELGISDPGDMKYLLSIIKPKVVIITDITQRYLESFDDMDDLVDEYEYLLKKAKNTDLIILNGDNPKIRKIANVSQIKSIFIGKTDIAQWKITDLIKTNRGQSVKIINNNTENQYNINRFGYHHVFSFVASLIIKDYVKKEKKN